MAEKRSGGTPGLSAFGSVLEAVSAGAGILALLGIAGVIGWDALKGGDDRLPALAVRAREIEPRAGSYVVRVSARNEADATAAGVQIEGELRQGGAAVETSHATISYVPGRSERSAGLVFSTDPRRGELLLRVEGYEEP